MHSSLLSPAARSARSAGDNLIFSKRCAIRSAEEDEHLYHTTGWCRELWIESLGLKAVLPPPEEKQDVKTAIGAARAKAARGKMTSRQKSV